MFNYEIINNSILSIKFRTITIIFQTLFPLHTFVQIKRTKKKKKRKKEEKMGGKNSGSLMDFVETRRNFLNDSIRRYSTRP